VTRRISAGAELGVANLGSRIVQDEVTLVESIPLARTDPDVDALRLGNAVLGGGFYSTR
jgi:hypothetical protein